MKKPRGLKLRLYAASMINIKNYLSVFPGAKEEDRCFEMEFNVSFLNRIPNIWIRQACVQGFDCKTITLKNL